MLKHFFSIKQNAMQDALRQYADYDCPCRGCGAGDYRGIYLNLDDTIRADHFEYLAMWLLFHPEVRGVPVAVQHQPAPVQHQPGSVQCKVAPAQHRPSGWDVRPSSGYGKVPVRKHILFSSQSAASSRWRQLQRDDSEGVVRFRAVGESKESSRSSTMVPI